MQLDKEEVHLKAGDVVIQRGTVHNWVNRGEIPCLMLYVLVATGTLQWRRLSADQGLRRRRGAVTAARQRLHKSSAQFANGQSKDGVDLIQNAFVHLIADVVDLPEAGLTPKDIRSQMAKLEIEEGLVDRVDNVLHCCDASRYGTSTQDQGLIEEAEQTLDALVQTLKAKKRFR